MTAQAGLTAQAAGHLATANYVGYLGGAVAGTLSHRLARSTTAWRTSLVVLIATLALMPLASNMFGWLTLRTVAGFASAVVFVVAVNSLLEHLRDHSPHLPGWGIRRRRRRNRTVGRDGVGDARYRGLAGRVVDGGGLGRRPDRRRLGHARDAAALPPSHRW